YGCWPLKGAGSQPTKSKPTTANLASGRAPCMRKKHTSGIVKLLLPPRQSRGVSQRTRNGGQMLGAHFLRWFGYGALAGPKRLFGNNPWAKIAASNDARRTAGELETLQSRLTR